MLHMQRNKNTYYVAKKFNITYSFLQCRERREWYLGGMTLFSAFSPSDLMFAFCVAFVAGWVKGMVGFAMPMVTISGLSLVLPPDLALAGLILPTLVTNGVQALREGWSAALASIRKFRVFLLVGMVFLFAGAQLVTMVPPQTFLLMIGFPVAFFALIQMLGVRLVLQQPSTRVEAVVSAIAGFIGGMSGVWGRRRWLPDGA